MKTRMVWMVLALAVLAAGMVAWAVWPARAGTELAPEAPDVFASPINGGCYIAAPNDCRLHVDPFAISIASGKRLVAFELQSNGTTVYTFRTDVSNPPPSVGTTYTPSLVMQDFAAVCGRTYVINIIGRDTGDANFLNMGQTASFTCPAGVP